VIFVPSLSYQIPLISKLFYGTSFFGAVLACIAVIFFYMKPSAEVCSVRIWIIFVGHSLIVLGIILKTYDLFIFYTKVHQQENIRVLKIKPQYNLFILLLGLLVQLIILIVWQSTDPFTLKTKLIDNINLKVTDFCTSENNNVWFGLEIAYFSILLIIGMLVVYFTWKVALNETKFMLITIYNYVIGGVLCVVFLYLLNVDDDGVFYVVCVINIVIIFTSIISNIIPPLSKKVIVTIKSSGSKSSREMQSKRTKSELLENTNKQSEAESNREGNESNKDDDESREDISSPTTPEVPKKRTENIKKMLP